MINLTELIDLPPYSLSKDNKQKILTTLLGELTQYHYEKCSEYKKVIEFYANGKKAYSNLSEIPFLPIRLLKEYELLSVPRTEVVKVLTSSGTTGQKTSKVFLDADTAKLQQKVLVKIVGDLIGGTRMPMIILDTVDVLKNRDALSARGAGILGFSLFASDKIYALDGEMNINFQGIQEFLAKHSGKPIFLFGFTYMVWLHFYKKLIEDKIKIDLSNGILLHGGGWKKLASESVSSETFKKSLLDACGLKRVHDYYGMAEQTGTIYTECSEGYLHCSNFSDIIIRDPLDFSVCNLGQPGVIQVLSVLPQSYPGHSLLTEDMGTLHGEDDCGCGKLGKYFTISGRIKNAEVRGCSDTYAATV